MKNILKKVVLLLAVAIIAFSCVACTSTGETNSVTDDSSNTESQQQTNVTNYSNYYNGTLPSSIESAKSVTVNNNEVRTGDELSYIEVIKKVEKSAVAILVKTSSGTSAGSGTIVNLSKTGDDENVYYVLTCYHVISTLEANITVCLPDANNRNYGDSDYNADSEHNFQLTGKVGGTIDKTQAVSLVGGDKDADVALLRLNITDAVIKANITKANIMDASKYSVCKGYEVFAIGNPTGVLQGTVSKGYISYVNRAVSIEDIGTMTLNQINLDIYHGSSGGGLYNFYGELVGITNAGSDEDSGLNYAITLSTSNDVNSDMGLLNVAKQLLGSYSDTNYGYISGRKVKFDFVVTVESDASDKPFIYSVTEGGLAYNAGLKASDIVTGFKVNDNEKVSDVSYAQFTEAMSGLKVGDTIVITVERTSYTYSNNPWGGSRITGTTTQSIDITLTVYQFYFGSTATSKSAVINTTNNGDVLFVDESNFYNKLQKLF